MFGQAWQGSKDGCRLISAQTADHIPDSAICTSRGSFISLSEGNMQLSVLALQHR